MLWHLDQYRNAKQGISIFKTYIGNTNRALLSPTYRNFLEAWSDMTENEIPKPKTLPEIYNETIFSNTHSANPSNSSNFLNKSPPVWAKENFRIVKDICNVTHTGLITANQLINSHTPRKHKHNPKQQDYIETLKLIPQEWKNQINQNISPAEPPVTKVNIISPKGKWQEKNITITKCKDLYRTIDSRRILPQYTQRRCETWQENSDSPRQVQWQHLFNNLYRNTKQKEAFDIRYRFLHLAQPSATKLKEIGQIHGSVDCKRSGRAEETQKHWLFYCPSSQNLLIYLLNLLEEDNTIQDCLLTPLLECGYEVPVSMELFEIYFITIRYIRRDTTYDKEISANADIRYLELGKYSPHRISTV